MCKIVCIAALRHIAQFLQDRGQLSVGAKLFLPIALLYAVRVALKNRSRALIKYTAAAGEKRFTLTGCLRAGGYVWRCGIR